ncbi:hypothetical protein E4U43_007463 [Claviceps pusilla]|uniref:DRBM domain-containing protein n=1 Tax=Claviceps pusilla TaxID=123648 RepID=A0A9P7NCF3_9HYPO|nr:hypothetical protein E4U43_007463 [Claviceps pusilla]
MPASQEAAQQAICVPWDKLLSWVQRQMASEMQTGRPVVLSRLQLEAVSHLVSFNEEPDVSDKDYVSLLLQSTQASRLSAPVFSNPEPVSMPVDGHFEPRWQCICTIESVGQFPRLGFGMSATQPAPRFQSKKNAKQFAAKQALEFLAQAPGPMQAAPLVLDKRPLPPSPQTKSSRPKWAPTPAPAPGPVHLLAASSIPPPPSAARANYPPEPVINTWSKKPSIFEQVALSTGRLGIDSPVYRVEPDPAGGNLFCGRPVFKNGGHVPFNLGFVSGVEGEAQAKRRVAEEVLAWAEGELRRRHDIFKSLWGEATLQGTSERG